MALMHNRSIGSLDRQYRVSRYRCTSQWASTERQLRVNRASTERQQSINTVSTECQQSVNRVSTLLGVASCIIQGLCYGIDPYSTYWQQFCANDIMTRLQHLSENERQQSVNDFVCCILYNPRAVLQHWSIIEVLAAFRGNIVIVNTVTPRNERPPSVNTASTERQQSMDTESTECQQSVNAFGCCIMYIPRALLRHLSIINVVAAVLCKCDRDMVTAPVWKWTSTERQRFRVLHLV